jgi:hypothetical protein
MITPRNIKEREQYVSHVIQLYTKEQHLLQQLCMVYEDTAYAEIRELEEALECKKPASEPTRSYTTNAIEKASQVVLEYMRQHPAIYSKPNAETLNLTPSTHYRALKHLISTGQVIPSNTKGYYRLGGSHEQD